MAIDSSSGTSPRSSLVTIASSSFSAVSKLRLAASGRVVSGKRSSSMIHQLADVGSGGLAEPLEVVAALQERHDTASRRSVGNLHQRPRRPGKILGLQPDLRERIADVRI